MKVVDRTQLPEFSHGVFRVDDMVDIVVHTTAAYVYCFPTIIVLGNNRRECLLGAIRAWRRLDLDIRRVI